MKLEFSEKLRDLDKKFVTLEENITEKINNNVDKKFNTLQQDIQELKIQNDEQEKRIDFLERQNKVRNLILFGVAEEEKSYSELESLLLGILSATLEVEISRNEIEFVRRIGNTSKTTRPIVFATTTLGKKIEILKNKNKLDNTGTYIKQDFTKKEMEKRKTVKLNLQKEVEKGNKAVIKSGKLIIMEHGNKKRPLILSPSPPRQNAEALDTSASFSSGKVKEPLSKKNRTFPKTTPTAQTRMKSYTSNFNANKSNEKTNKPDTNIRKSPVKLNLSKNTEKEMINQVES